MAYTPGDVLVRAVMEGATGLPQDRIVNDFAFQTLAMGAPSSTDVTNMFAAVDGFYRDEQANGKAVGEYLSAEIDRGVTHQLQAFHIIAGDLGSPFREDDWLGPVGAQTTSGLPTEVAGVLSFHADLTGAVEEIGATRPKARRRGRIYIGPLEIGAVATATVPYFLDTTFNQTLRQAAVAMMDEANASYVPWCVWSRVDALLRPVVGGWTDNAPDTQRRRGVQSSARVVWG